MVPNAFRSRPHHTPGTDLPVVRSRRRIVTPAPFRAVVALVGAVALVLLSNDAGFGQTIDENLWVTNGTVYAVAHDGGTIYIGGNFTRVGPSTGGGAPLDAVSRRRFRR